MKIFTTAAAAVLLAGAAYAEAHVTGDAEAGATVFERQCVACHVVVNDEGETLAGRRAQTGPNLYNLAARGIGQVEDFRYSDGLKTLGEAGEMWTEEHFVGYAQDPTGWLRETLDDRRARGNMAFQLRSEEDALNVYAYLVSLAPAE